VVRLVSLFVLRLVNVYVCLRSVRFFGSPFLRLRFFGSLRLRTPYLLVGWLVGCWFARCLFGLRLVCRLRGLRFGWLVRSWLLPVRCLTLLLRFCCVWFGCWFTLFGSPLRAHCVVLCCTRVVGFVHVVVAYVYVVTFTLFVVVRCWLICSLRWLLLFTFDLLHRCYIVVVCLI